ncbi:esterase/lipase family protein [Clostridium rectalis]|uniref:esterase/lipase family protein n=1 Tax=Clostridium rectalis TaxID=2040295 RepID=UPI000F62CE6A|nr:lipase [Clostridium rectalis]
MRRFKFISGFLALFLVIMLKVSVKAETEHKNMGHPTVLVHGFMGWGKDEIPLYHYWGAFTDLEKQLRKDGYDVYVAAVGPVASNWDRACELYAYIKGGTVDYGKAHSKKYGHARYGRTYKGIYPQWGRVNKEDKINKVHIVGHSMGGQTIRVLDQLLEEGSEEERGVTDEKELSTLFKGEQQFLASVTSISSPHDGTTLADEGSGNVLVDFAQKLMGGIGSITGYLNKPVFDFKLDQWGLKKEKNELTLQYFKKVFNSNIWKDTKDISVWDLSTDGAREINKWVTAKKDKYYFSWTTKATKVSHITGNSIPDVKYMNPLFIPNSVIMGRYTRNEPGRVTIDENWQPNDGFVNVISQNGPKISSKDEIVKFNGKPQIGKWNDMPLLENMDHEDIIHKSGYVIPWYKKLINGLNSLPEIQ